MVISDVRSTWRGLRRQWPFTLTAVATLALGIGGATTVAGVAHGVLLSPYEYREPHRLVLVTAVDPRYGEAPVAPSIADYLDLRERTRSFEELASFVTLGYNLPDDRGGGAALPLQVNFVSAGLLPMLGVSPMLGRSFSHSETAPGTDLHTVVISHDLWVSRFGADPAIVGQAIRLDTTPYTVIGVMPPGFRFGYRFAANADAWAPLESWLARYGETMQEQARDARAYYNVLGKLAPAVGVRQATDDLAEAARSLAALHPETNRDVRFQLQSLRDAEAGAITPYLRMASLAVALLLAMAAVNVSGLLLIRAAARRAEVAARLALGATPYAITRQWLVEGVTIGLMGAAAGALLAAAALQIVDGAVPIERPVWMRFAVDWSLAAASMGLGVVVGALLGVLPAWVAVRVPVADVLRESGRTSGTSSESLRRLLVAGQVALACLLLATGGVLVRSLWQLTHTEVGITPERLLTAYVSPPGDKYRDEDDLPAYASLYQRVLERLRSLPEVEAAGGMNVLPFDGESMPGEGVVVTREGDTVESQRGTPSVVMVRASHDAFEVGGIPLLQGERFREDDTRQRPLVALASLSMANRFWPGDSAIGKRVKPGPADQPGPWYTIVGVVGDVRVHGAGRPAPPALYRPYMQVAAGSFHFLVRTRGGDPAAAADLVRHTIAAVDPDVAVYHVRPFADRLANANWQARLWAIVCGVFAIAALLLAAIGVYGVTATSVAHREREFGIRLALGARPADVSWRVQREVGGLTALGIAGGLAGAALLLPVVEDLLATTTSPDGLVLSAVGLIVLTTAIVAGWLPARRAGRADPAQALRALR